KALDLFRARNVSEPIFPDEITRCRNGAARAQRLSRAIFGFGICRGSWLCDVDRLAALDSLATSEPNEGLADVRGLRGSVGLVCPGILRIQPLCARAGLDGIYFGRKPPGGDRKSIRHFF